MGRVGKSCALAVPESAGRLKSAPMHAAATFVLAMVIFLSREDRISPRSRRSP